MSQSPSVQSLDGSSPTPDLQPGLKVALGSMDVELEAELARYRRQSKKSQPFAPISTTQIPEGKFQVPAPTLSADSQPPSTPPTAAASISIAPTAPSTPKTEEIATIPPAAQTPSAPNDYLDSSEELLRTTDDEPVESSTPKQNALLTPLGIGSGLLFLLAATTLGYVAFNRSGGQNRTPSPTTSQRGSAADSVSDSPTAKAGREGQMPSGPNLASEEFVDLDLNSLSSADPSPEPIPSPIATSTSTPTSGTASPSPSANADSLNNLNSVLSAPPSPQKPNETPAETPTAAKPTPTSSSSVLPSPSASSPAASPSPQASTPATDTMTELPAPIVNEDYYGFYFVVVEAQPQLWTKASAAVPDAYNRSFPIGDRIQMGAFENREDAERLVESLKEQNISAQIYQPE